jgi:hypothetical protein
MFLPKPGMHGLVIKRLRESGGHPVIVAGAVYILIGKKHRKWIDNRPLEELCVEVREAAPPRMDVVAAITSTSKEH